MWGDAGKGRLRSYKNNVTETDFVGVKEGSDLCASCCR